MPIGAKWYPFKDDNVELAPRQSGAYELGYRDTVVYIGSSTSSIQSRLHEHRKQKRFMKVTHFRFRKTKPDEARASEIKLCKEFEKENGKRPRLQKVTLKEDKSSIDKYYWG